MLRSVAIPRFLVLVLGKFVVGLLLLLFVLVLLLVLILAVLLLLLLLLVRVLILVLVAAICSGARSLEPAA